MPSIKLIFFVIIVCFLTSTACENKLKSFDKDIKNSQFLTDYLGEKINRNFKGIVLDEIKIPIKDAIISIGNKTAITNSLGTFEIKSASVNSLHAFINSTKNDYIITDVSIIPNDSINDVKIVFLKETEPCLFWVLQKQS